MRKACNLARKFGVTHVGQHIGLLAHLHCWSESRSSLVCFFLARTSLTDDDDLAAARDDDDEIDYGAPRLRDVDHLMGMSTGVFRQ